MERSPRAPRLGAGVRGALIAGFLAAYGFALGVFGGIAGATASL